jgi:small subunit ribosomal protein S9
MATKKAEKYIESVGRRKEAIARVRLFESKTNSITVNDKPLAEFFKTEHLQTVASEALLGTEELTQKFEVTAKVNGGGIASQAESVRLGIARSIVKFNEELRKDLKKKGFLKRDPRAKERRKFGLKKARKAAQWSKR